VTWRNLKLLMSKTSVDDVDSLILTGFSTLKDIALVLLLWFYLSKVTFDVEVVYMLLVGNRDEAYFSNVL
jgi:hypothetical protein